jgi:hypothetical protein
MSPARPITYAGVVFRSWSGRRARLLQRFVISKCRAKVLVRHSIFCARKRRKKVDPDVDSSVNVMLPFVDLIDCQPMEERTKMAKRPSFNLSETIREYRKSHWGVRAMDAFAAIKKGHPSQTINEGTFKSTFYKLASDGKRTVRRRKPGRVSAGNGSPESIMQAGLHFIRLAGSVEAARERLVGLEALIETAK